MNRIVLLIPLALGLSLAPVLSWAAEPPAGQSRAVADATDAFSDHVQVYSDLLRGYESLANRFATTTSEGQAVDEAAFKAAERQMKEEIASKHHLTMLQLEQIANTMTPSYERYDSKPISWWHRFSWWDLLFFVASIPTCLLIGRIVFGGWDGFWSTYSDSHNIWSGAVDYHWAKIKIAIFLVWTCALLAVEYCVIQRLAQ